MNIWIHYYNMKNQVAKDFYVLAKLLVSGGQEGEKKYFKLKISHIDSSLKVLDYKQREIRNNCRTKTGRIMEQRDA